MTEPTIVTRDYLKSYGVIIDLLGFRLYLGKNGRRVLAQFAQRAQASRAIAPVALGIE